jgi:hypothetical protein
MTKTETTDESAILDIVRQNIRMAVALMETNFSDAARKAGLGRNVIQQFVAGKTSISYFNMFKVCLVLNIPIGIIHQPNAITPANIRVHQALAALPDHLAEKALDVARDHVRPGSQDDPPNGVGWPHRPPP